MPFDKTFLAVLDRFLRFVTDETGFPVIVCDESATIVRATVRKRIGTVHAGAQRILRGEVEEAAVSAEEAARNTLVKEGYNCPVTVDGLKVGTFGIAGPLAQTRPLARIASGILASWVKEGRQREALHAASAEVTTGLRALGERVQAAVEAARRSMEVLGASSQRASSSVDRAAGVVQTVQEIAQQSRILSINGAIEATRAGDHGKSFAVVAKDMTLLAEQTSATAKAIEAQLTEIRGAIAQVHEAADRTSAASLEQERALAEMRRVMQRLQEAVTGIERTFGQV